MDDLIIYNRLISMTQMSLIIV